MSHISRALCQQAMQQITLGHFAVAQILLRNAMKQTTNGRAKSKLMLAIRECNRAMRAAQ